MKTITKVVSRNLDPKELAFIAHKLGQSIYSVTLEKVGAGYPVDAKSILGVLSLGIKEGDTLLFSSHDHNVLGIIEVFNL